MITGMEIRNQQFRKSIRGLNEEEVKNFIERIALDYESLYGENAQLKETVQRLEHEITRYRRIEETMNNTLILAQQTAENHKINARKEADLILEEAKQKIFEVLMSYQDVVKRVNTFNAEMKGQMTGQLELLEKNQQKMAELSEVFKGNDLKAMLGNLEVASNLDE
ncbi:MAG: DivIVA domain-containing protein [Syntrophomonadaceae bacterium]|jgi:cell division initiation protein|nr:DivIVA domain-containing protein [Syntrophomonadaceae bacterium]